MFDVTNVLKKIVPEDDGPGKVVRRKFTVAAINGDNTVNITDGAGVTTPNVPVLAGAQLIVGSKVQVLSERGAMLVLGKVGAAIAPPTTLPYARVTFGTPTLTTGAVTTLTITSNPFNAGSVGVGATDLTVPAGQGGEYEIGASLWYATQATGSGLRQARTSVNGAEFYSKTMTAVGINGIRVGASFTTRRSLAAGDTVNFGGFQTSGGNLALDANSHAWIERIR
jgi:hypothetical protein